MYTQLNQNLKYEDLYISISKQKKDLTRNEYINSTNYKFIHHIIKVVLPTTEKNYLPTTKPTTQIKNLWHTMSISDTLYTRWS